MSSLLAHLAAKFSDQNEVVATDSLAFVLRQSAPAREALEGLLGAVVRENVAVTRVSPQVVAGTESRPDLATYGPDGTLTAFLEAKFWAGLTDAQPVDYLRRLREQGGKALLFVVPEERTESIWAELAKRSMEAGVPLRNSPASEGARAAATSAGTSVVVTSWKRLLAGLIAGCGRAEDRAAVANLEQLVGLVRRFEAEGFGPMSSADLTDLTLPRRMMALADLVQAVVARATAQELVNVSGLRPTHTWTTTGRYLGLLHGNAWIGIDHAAWARYQSTPLWLCFGANGWSRAYDVYQALRAWESEEPSRLHLNDDDSVAIPLFIRPGAERDEVVEDLVRQLRAVDDALAAVGLVRVMSTAALQA